jgi:uncharacterized integral membrane protein
MSMINEPREPKGEVVHTNERFHLTPKQTLAGAIVVLSLIFILQNTGEGHFSFLVFDFRAPMWIWLLIVFASGVGTGLLLAWRRARRKATEA